MTCECGAFKTYKAGPKSTLHSDWCNQSPTYKPPKAKVITAKEVTFTFQGQPVQSFYSGTYKVSPAPIKCDGHSCPNPADYEITYPANFASGMNPSYNVWAGRVKHYCKSCARPQDHGQLTSQGCTIVQI